MFGVILFKRDFGGLVLGVFWMMFDCIVVLGGFCFEVDGELILVDVFVVVEDFFEFEILCDELCSMDFVECVL